jgi:hypothetical protein
MGNDKRFSPQIIDNSVYDRIYRLQGVEFDWDEREEKPLRMCLHGISNLSMASMMREIRAEVIA